jgi:DNA-binding LacI/PurR family transcriptional regulator
MTTSRPATIADVAAAAGVGIGTVSRVLNRAPNVRDATRATVLAAIGRLGYRPSHLAMALSRGTPRIVALVVPHLTSPSVVLRVAGALAVLGEQGYDTAIFAASDTQAIGVLAAATRTTARRWKTRSARCDSALASGSATGGR